MSTSTSTSSCWNLWVLCLLLSLFPYASHSFSRLLHSFCKHRAVFVHFFSTSPSIMVIGWFFSHIFFLLFFFYSFICFSSHCNERCLNSAHIVRPSIVYMLMLTLTITLYDEDSLCICAKKTRNKRAKLMWNDMTKMIITFCAVQWQSQIILAAERLSPDFKWYFFIFEKCCMYIVHGDSLSLSLSWTHSNFCADLPALHFIAFCSFFPHCCWSWAAQWTTTAMTL